MRRFLLSTILLAFALSACKSGFRAVEKVIANQPDLPPVFYSPQGTKVYAKTQPNALEFATIDRGIQITLDATANFSEWRQFRNHSDFRVWLLENHAAITPAENPRVKGCPIIATWNSSTGYASDITAGFLPHVDYVESVFPYMMVGRVTPQFDRPECWWHLEQAVANGAEHFEASNDIHYWWALYNPDYHPRFRAE